MSDIVAEKTVVVLEVNWTELAKRVEAHIMNKMREDLDHWQDYGMRAMVLGDASGGLEVCAALNEGDHKKAAEKLWAMDTAPREWVYDFIEREAGEKFFVHYFR